MADKIASTMFAGNAADKVTPVDVYVKDIEAKGLVKAAVDSGAVSNTDVPTTTTTQSSASNVAKEKKGVKGVLNRIATSSTYTTSKKLLGARADYQRMLDGGASRKHAALVGLSAALPFQLPAACQAIIDNFRQQMKQRYDGYEVIRDGVGHFMKSDQVQCALQAFEMLTGIKGISDSVTQKIVDVSTTAQVIAGMVTTLIDYEMVDNIEAVIGVSPSTEAARLALGIASPRAVSSGNTYLVNYFLEKVGINDMIFNNPNLTHNFVQHYDKERSGVGSSGNHDAFFDTLNRIDPHWDRPNGVEYYHSELFQDASPSAMEAFLSHPIYGTLAMVGDIEYFHGGTYNRDPSVVEVTRDLYPDVTSPLVESTPWSLY